jgi:hypothetical protein
LLSLRPAQRARSGTAVAATALLAASLTAGIAPAASAADVSCTVAYSVTSEWNDGFGATVAIRNEGAAPIADWNVAWNYADGQRITTLWNGIYTQSGGAVSVRGADWNRAINPGAAAEFGFNASKSGQNRAPTGFTVNGVSCAGPNSGPNVALTGPADNATYAVPATIPLAATAADSDGSVSAVEFYAGTTLLGSDTTAPYQYAWTGATPGDYSVTARAIDNRGAATVSSPLAIRVLAAPAVLTTPSTVRVRQGDSSGVDVKLATQPSGPVAVSVTRSGSSDLTATPAALTFTQNNWNTPQRLEISSAANGGALASATFTVSASGLTPSTIDVAEIDANASDYRAAFLEQYNKIKDADSGYFRNFGGLLVPYHSVETLLVEAPDHGHETTSEAFSYYLWLEAAYGQLEGDWAPFNSAWASMEKYIIPAHNDQPTNDKYNAGDPATYAPENPRMDSYPAVLDNNVPVGADPIAGELKNAYGTSDVYGMHWLLDVDNVYGFGHCGDGSNSAPAYINTYQRGSSESVWETIPQPSCDTFAFGGPNGYLDLFTKDAGYAKQWKFTNAPDADARAVQVAYLANQWATAQGNGSQVADVVKKASKMGDYLRYAMFDKYFKKIGDCVGPAACPGGSGREAQHYLMSWYYAWGGATDTSAGWAWRIGDGAAHQGYQNPLAAYALANDPAMKPISSTGASDWQKSLDRQLEFLQWLQSADGGISGGATNSWDGQYGTPPSGSPTFYGMYYDSQPVWHDPPSNRWFGFQVWGLERTAELYQQTGDARAKKILDKWVPWAIANTTVGTGGDFQIPSDMTWTGQPDTWNPSSPGGNSGLHVSVTSHSQDVGVAASYAKVLLNYAAESGNAQARTVGEGLLDALLAHTDSIGIAIPETRTDYNRFDDEYNSSTGEGVYVPQGWTGDMPNGDQITAGADFLSIRSFYEDDPEWPKVQSYLDGGSAPAFTYHRFWAQAEIATAFSLHVQLFG